LKLPSTLPFSPWQRWQLAFRIDPARLANSGAVIGFVTGSDRAPLSERLEYRQPSGTTAASAPARTAPPQTRRRVRLRERPKSRNKAAGDEERRRGSTAMAFRQTRSSAGGTRRFNCRGGRTSPFFALSTTSRAVSPWNGGRPVRRA